MAEKQTKHADNDQGHMLPLTNRVSLYKGLAHLTRKMHTTVLIYLVAVRDQLLQRTHLFIDPVPSSLHQHSAAVKNAVRTIYQQAACLSENRLFFASTI